MAATMTRYDYLIVGGGTAGCILAARLSEDRRKTVMMVEAGGSSRSLWVDMPAAVGHAIASRRFGYELITEPEPLLDGRTLRQIQGRALGGSSAINGMMYLRGNRADYDMWATLGAQGWDYESVLPYFIRSEGHSTRRDGFHGKDWPMVITSPTPEHLSPLHRAFVAAGAAAGFEVSTDFNGSQQAGFGYYDQTIRKGTRAGVDRAYLAPARSRPNLTVLTNTNVWKIVLRGQEVSGVVLGTPTDNRTVSAGIVIVCAGGYQSPALLMRSGIGPDEVLGNAGIETRMSLSGVGRNLQNHPDIPIQFHTDADHSLHRLMQFPRKQMAGIRWLLNRTGPAAQNHFEAGAFVRSAAGAPRPDLQLTLLNLALDPATGLPRRGAFQIHLTLVQPRSRGEVRLTADGEPSVRLNYLHEPADREALRNGLTLVRSIVGQAPFAPFSPAEYEPGAQTTEPEDIDKWLAARMASFYHPVGTCRMGADTDSEAVVDPGLRVRGLANLFVADASVMPTIPAGNTYAPTAMIAEKGADLIRAAS